MVGRHKLEASLVDIFGDTSTAQYSLSKVRSKVRTFLLKIAAGEYIHPEIVRMQMGVFVKSAILRAEVFTIPSKTVGLRVQSSEVHIGAPGVGKGMGCAWGDMIMSKSRDMASEYLKVQSKLILEGDHGENQEAGPAQQEVLMQPEVPVERPENEQGPEQEDAVQRDGPQQDMVVIAAPGQGENEVVGELQLGEVPQAVGAVQGQEHQQRAPQGDIVQIEAMEQEDVVQALVPVLQGPVHEAKVSE